MAISSDVHSFPEFRFGIAEQSAWGTANTTDAQIYEVYTTATPQIAWNVIRDDVPRSDGLLIENETDRYVSQNGATYEVSVEGVLTDKIVDLLVFSVMQDLASEAATTPYLKTWQWDAGTTHMDYASNSGAGVGHGILLTLCLSSPATGESWYVKDAVCKSLTISSDPGSNGGRATFSATFMSGKNPVYSGSFTPGSWVSVGSDFYIHQSLNSKQLGGNDLVLYSQSITLENGLAVSSFASGEAEQYANAGGGKPYKVSGSLNVKYDANTKDIVDEIVTNPSAGAGEKALLVRWGDGSADGTLSIKAEAFIDGDVIVDPSDERGAGLTIPWRGMYNGSDYSVQFLVANTIG